MKHKDAVMDLLKKHGVGKPWKGGKHWKYKLKNGQTVTLAVSPSDPKYWTIKLQDVRRVLGLSYTGGVTGVRREKKTRQKHNGKYEHLELEPVPYTEALPPPTLEERLQAEKEKEKEEPEPEPTWVFRTYPRTPIRVLDRHHAPRYKGVQYSPEVIAEINFMHERGVAEKEIQAYLSKIRNGGAAAMAMQNETQGQIQGGEIENALTSAQEKVRFHKAEMQRHHVEADRWSQVAQNLSATLELVRGKTPTRKSAETAGENVPKGYWTVKIPELIKKAGHPMTQKEFLHYVVQETGMTESNVRQAIWRMLNKETLTEIDHKLVLASETEPERKEA